MAAGDPAAGYSEVQVTLQGRALPVTEARTIDGGERALGAADGSPPPTQWVYTGGPLMGPLAGPLPASDLTFTELVQ